MQCRPDSREEIFPYIEEDSMTAHHHRKQHMPHWYGYIGAEKLMAGLNCWNQNQQLNASINSAQY